METLEWYVNMKQEQRFLLKPEYWVTVYESHDSDLVIFGILFANSNDDTVLMW